jgi:hypothetical protein
MDELFESQQILIPNNNYTPNIKESWSDNEDEDDGLYNIFQHLLPESGKKENQLSPGDHGFVEEQLHKNAKPSPSIKQKIPMWKINSITSSKQQSKIQKSLPARYRNQDWHLLYSTREHGISLATLYYNCEKEEPLLFIIKTKDSYTMGAFIQDPIRPKYNRYYGSGETFVFSFDDDDEYNFYRWQQTNQYFVYTGLSYVALGGSANDNKSRSSSCALYFDKDIERGASYECSTFGNEEPLYLGGGNQFEIYALEVWTFDSFMNHSSKDLLRKKDHFSIYTTTEEYKNSLKSSVSEKDLKKETN